MKTFEIRRDDGTVKTITLDHLMQTTGVASKRSLWAYTANVGDEARFQGQAVGLFFTLKRIN